MKKKLLGMAFMSILSCNSIASGVRGGGHVVEVNGQLELVDIVTSATCDWFSGKEIKEKSVAIDQILKKIEKLDWYLALELKREIEFLSWCMTGNLYSLPAGDADSFVQQLTKGVQQVAFRYNGNAYIDQSKYSRLNQSSQAYLVFHEMLHSYLPMDLEMRIFKLQSLVSAIRKVDLGQITTRERLHLNLANGDMNFPLTVNKLEPYKKSLQFILGTTEERIETILSTNEPEKLIHSKILEALPYVANWDKEAILRAGKSISDALVMIFLSQDLNNIRFVLSQQKYNKINPAAVALSVYDQLSPAVQNEVTASSYFLNIIKEGSDYLNEIQFIISHGRIVGDLALQSISDKCQLLTPVYTTSLVQLNEQCQLPPKIQAIADIIVTLIETENDEVLEQLETNDDLILALRMELPRSRLTQLDSPIAREKDSALNVLKTIQAKLVDRMKKDIISKTSRPSPFVEHFFKKLKI